ncbi:MAG: ATP-binding protein [Methanobacteriota archaeon]
MFNCFFQLVSKHYEKTSTIFTSNKSYGEWGEEVLYRRGKIKPLIMGNSTPLLTN